MSSFEENLEYASNMESGSQREYRRTYKDGVNVLYMRENQKKGITKIVFRLLPAFKYDSDNPRLSWVPSILPDGHLSPFGCMLFSVKFVGHGDFQTRRELVSRKTADRNAVCPLKLLEDFIKSNQDDWGYLMKDVGKFRQPGYKKAPFKGIQPSMLANVVDVYDQTGTVRVGEFSHSAYISLMARGDRPGLMFQRNDSIPPELFQQSYLYQYAKGDLTDPQTGLVLECARDTKEAAFQGYVINTAKDQNGNPWRLQIGQQQLAARYDMKNVESIVNVPTEQELVDDLAELLNGRSPKGYHEHALLKMAFEGRGWRVPDPPSAPMSGPVAGFSAPVPPPAATDFDAPIRTAAAPQPVPQPVPQAAAAPAVPPYVPPIPPQQKTAAAPQPVSGFVPSPGYNGVPGETKPMSNDEIKAIMAKLRH